MAESPEPAPRKRQVQDFAKTALEYLRQTFLVLTGVRSTLRVALEIIIVAALILDNVRHLIG